MATSTSLTKENTMSTLGPSSSKQSNLHDFRDANLPFPVILESPYTESDLYSRDANMAYLARCLHDSCHRGEAPLASHGLYTMAGVLDDSKSYERRYGILCGYAWWSWADLIVFYTDHGWSKGMIAAYERAQKLGFRFQFRSLD